MPPERGTTWSLSQYGRTPFDGQKGRLPASAAAHQTDDQEQDDGADRRIDDLGDEAGAEVDTELGEQQARNQRAGDTDQDVADDAEARAADDLAGKPARDQADEQDDDDAFVGQDHCNFPPLARLAWWNQPTHNGLR